MNLIEDSRRRRLKKSEERIILSDKLLAFKYVTMHNLTNYDVSIFSDPHDAYNVIKNTRDVRLEIYISSSAKHSYMYAVYVIGRRFRDGEDIILSSEWKDSYLTFIITSTDEDVDDLIDIIRESDHLLTLYAIHVSDKRQIEIENTLNVDDASAYLKKHRVIGHIKLDQKENMVIFPSEYHAYEFACRMKHRNTDIEGQFIRNPKLIWLYSRGKLRSRWKEAEEYLSDIYLLRYTRINDMRWPTDSWQHRYLRTHYPDMYE